MIKDFFWKTYSRLYGWTEALYKAGRQEEDRIVRVKGDMIMKTEVRMM